MILQYRGEMLRFIEQHDHALFSGALAHAWRTSQGARLPYEEVLLNACHDLAWAPINAIDTIRAHELPFDHERGMPHDFTTLPTRDKILLYAQGLELMEDIHPLVGLVMSLHYGIFIPREPYSEEFHATEDARRIRLAAKLGVQSTQDARVLAAYERLKYFDMVSLYACLGTPEAAPRTLPRWLTPSYSVDGTHYAFGWSDGESTLTLDPFPFDEPLVHEIPYRDIHATRFESPRAFIDTWRHDSLPGTWRLRVEPA